MPSYKLNRNTNRIELYFSGIPEYETRNSLKRHGWRWEPRNTCWWHTDDEQARRYAKVLCDVQIEHTEVEGPKIENHGFFQAGSCGKLSEWILWPTGTLFVYGFGEIEDCNYHLLEQSSLYAVRDKVKAIKIHGGISRIGKRAFYKFCEVRSVELADGITEIGDYAFAYCEQLETVKLPNKLVTIGTQAFRDCINLNEIEIPKSTENIAPDAFRGWKSNQRVFKNVDDFRGREVKIPLTTEMLCQPQNVYFEDFVSISNANWCVRNNHEIETIRAKVFVLMRNGEIAEEVVPAGYCKQCKRYYIEQWVYEKLRNKGVLLCQIVSALSSNQTRDNDYYGQLSPESILKQSGYSVSEKEGLTSEQRKRILICLMESGICRKERITSHLSWLIKQREHRWEFGNAVSKWREDREFVSSYALGSARMVVIKLIRARF